MNDEWNKQRIELNEDELNRLKVDEQDISAPPHLSIDDDDTVNLPMKISNNNVYNALSHATVFIISIWSPWIAFLGPLLLWFLLKNKYSSVEAHAKEVLNFQLTILIASAMLFIPFIFFLVLLSLFLSEHSSFLLEIGVFSFMYLFSYVPRILIIIATVKAIRGGFYRYPLTIRFIAP